MFPLRSYPLFRSHLQRSKGSQETSKQSSTNSNTLLGAAAREALVVCAVAELAMELTAPVTLLATPLAPVVLGMEADAFVVGNWSGDAARRAGR